MQVVKTAKLQVGNTKIQKADWETGILEKWKNGIRETRNEIGGRPTSPTPSSSSGIDYLQSIGRCRFHWPD